MEARILLVDDTLDKLKYCTKAIRQSLNDIGMKEHEIFIFAAGTYTEAVDIYERNIINLVITDRMLPGKEDSIHGANLGGDDFVDFLLTKPDHVKDIMVISARDDDEVDNDMFRYESQGIQYIMRGRGEEPDAKRLAAKVVNIFSKETAVNTLYTYKGITFNSNMGTIKVNDKNYTLSEAPSRLLALLLRKTKMEIPECATYKEVYREIYPNDQKAYEQIEDKPRIAKVVQALRDVFKEAGTIVEIKNRQSKGYYLD